jgi:hypothetical protein
MIESVLELPPMEDLNDTPCVEVYCRFRLLGSLLHLDDSWRAAPHRPKLYSERDKREAVDSDGDIVSVDGEMKSKWDFHVGLLGAVSY